MLRAMIFALAAAVGLAAAPAFAAEEAEHPEEHAFGFEGPFGVYDMGAVQRGFLVYKQVCAACHGLSYISFRNLAEPGGPGYSPAQAAAVAGEYKIQDGPNDAGEMFEREGWSHEQRRAYIAANAGKPQPGPTE